jgi:cytoskeletal protein CcmA (bactofilin family)
MSIFKKTESQVQKPRERPVTAARAGTPDAAMSIIGSGMLVVGDIVTEGTVRIEGEVRGTIRAGKAVVLGQGGHVDGDIVTQDAVVGGSVVGTIVAATRAELQSTCVVNGQIRTRPEHLKLEEGARFTGTVQMFEEEGSVADTSGKEDVRPYAGKTRISDRSRAGAAETDVSSANDSTSVEIQVAS